MENQTNSNIESHKRSGALDAFLNLLSLVTMAWSAIAFGGVVFQIINKFFGEPAFGYETRFRLETLQFNVASLIIVVPIFLMVIGILHKHYKQGKLNPQSGIYRWLTYLMLFAAVANIIGSLIALVYKLLEGDYAIAFILKALIVLLIAVGIFGYYFYDLRRHDYSKRSQVSFISYIAVSVLVLAAIITGFVIAGSPQNSRMIKFDQKRVEDLNELRWQLQNYYKQNEVLPEDLSAGQFSRFKDPVTDEQYEYRVISENRFEMCANFNLDALDDNYMRYGTDEWYFHKAGRQCFEVKIEDEKVLPEPIPIR